VRTALVVAAICLGTLTACGLGVQSADLFLLTRVGQGKRLTLLVSDGGTIRCNGGAAKPLSDPLLLQARDLATSLDTDAKAKLRIPPSPNSVFSYTVKLQDGSISFPDTAGSRHSEIAQTEQFVLQAEGVCGLSG
jgi:hypothetical protein